MENYSNWPPSLNKSQLQVLKQHALDYALSHGLIMKTKPPHAATASHAPFALFPSPYPSNALDQAYKLQPIFNRLVHLLSQDEKFIQSVFDDLSKYDEFTAKLYQIYTSSRAIQKITLGIHRSDYMLNHLSIQQVEINTIAASFAALSTKCTDMHKYLADRGVFFNDADASTMDILSHRIPENNASSSISKGISEAYKLYNNKKAVVLMVVQPGERNVFDQRWLEYALAGIKVVRKTLLEIHKEAHLSNNKLIIDDKEVAVVYYRSGYGPGDYPGEDEWKARALVEASMAIKCPTIAYQLIGAKKVQQILTEKGVLENFLLPNECALVRECFAGIYPLDRSEAGLKAREMALKEPEKYVMKPQREGGGNNFYGQDVAKQLQTMSDQEISGHVLMDRIMPPPYKNCMVRDGELVDGVDVVCELGIYGIFLTDGDGKVCLNEAGGHLLRTKGSSTNEGGVAAGFAVIDSPLLFNN